jgi:hypothetical protein
VAASSTASGAGASTSASGVGASTSASGVGASTSASDASTVSCLYPCIPSAASGPPGVILIVINFMNLFPLSVLIFKYTWIELIQALRIILHM